MHVISQKALRAFWALHPQSESSLRAWHHVVEQADWKNFAEVRATYAGADVVGRFVVFNIGGNKYRLIAAIHYNRGKVYVRHVLTHSDYDRGTWKDAGTQSLPGEIREAPGPKRPPRGGKKAPKRRG
jgi:mRNA interferase HigB